MPINAATSFRVTWRSLIKAMLLIVLALLVLRSAWVGDDAYITFRTVDNFTHGHGLTWNVGERVQAYTHPLWMLLLSLIYLFTHEIFYTTIVVSLLLTVAAAYFLCAYLADGMVSAAFAILALVASKPFVDYTTSGLENPLTYLLLTVFFIVYFRRKEGSRPVFLLSLCGALVVLNRMDNALLIAPVVLYTLWTDRSVRSIIAVAAGAIPFVLWEIFSIFYYGFPFPNTAYAKLNTGIARDDLISQGFHYLQNGVDRSPFTIFVIGASILYALSQKSLRLIAPAIGMLLYVVYVVRIGGDFMEGRFLAVPFLVGVIIFARHRFSVTYSESSMIALTALALGLLWPNSPLRTNTDYGNGPELYYDLNGIADERAGYYQYTSPLLQDRTHPVPNHPWVVDGLNARKDSTTLLWRGGVGFVGYFAGPHVYIVDKHALTDPLLSRLPIYTPKKWRIGHFTRGEPPGYTETLESGTNQIADSSLAEFYDRLTTVIRDPLFNWNRCKEIWKFNAGQYSHLLREYNSRPQRVALRNFNTPRPEGTAYNAGGCFLLLKPGLRVEIERVSHAKHVEISADSNDEYVLHFLIGSVDQGSVWIKPRRIPQGGLRVETLTIPEEAVESGFDAVLIVPKGGDETYSIGHLRFIDE